MIGGFNSDNAEWFSPFGRPTSCLNISSGIYDTRVVLCFNILWKAYCVSSFWLVAQVRRETAVRLELAFLLI